MDLSGLSDVELVKRWYEEIKVYAPWSESGAGSRRRIYEIDAEARARGEDRINAAFEAVNRERDPAAYVQEGEP